MATWPTELPGFGVVGGARVGIDDPTARSTMDAGPPSRRNRFTAVTRPVSYQMPLTGAQIAVLENFYFNTTRHGSLSFDWISPLDGSAISMAFKAPPEYAGRIGDSDTDKRLWIASLSFEIQP